MKRWGKGIGIMAILVFILFAGCFQAASAYGVGISPDTLTIPSAMRGMDYERTFFVYNAGDTDNVIMLHSSGPAGEWVAYYTLEDPTTPIQQVTVPGGGDGTVLLRVTIPEDAANGVYTASIDAELIPGGETDKTKSGMTVAFLAQSILTLDVTGVENLNGTVKSITVSDTEVNYPLMVEVMFQNTGNVIANPVVNVEIRQDNSAIGTAQADGPAIKPLSTDKFHATWETTGISPGNYTALVDVILGGKVISQEVKPFTILPTGTLSRKGALLSLTYAGETNTESEMKITGEFMNTGMIPTMAKLIGEVYRDGVFAGKISSEELWVPVSGREELVSYYVVPEPGSYRVLAYSLYEGKKTEVKDFNFTSSERIAVQPNAAASAPISPVPGVLALILGLFLTRYTRVRKD